MHYSPETSRRKQTILPCKKTKNIPQYEFQIDIDSMIDNSALSSLRTVLTKKKYKLKLRFNFDNDNEKITYSIRQARTP